MDALWPTLDPLTDLKSIFVVSFEVDFSGPMALSILEITYIFDTSST